MTEDLSPWGLVEANVRRHSREAAPVPDDRLLTRLGELVDWAKATNLKAVAAAVAELKKLQDQLETAFAQRDRELERRHQVHRDEMAAERKAHDAALAKEKLEIAQAKQQAANALAAAKADQSAWAEKNEKLKRKLAALEAA